MPRESVNEHRWIQDKHQRGWTDEKIIVQANKGVLLFNYWSGKLLYIIVIMAMMAWLL